ncbi:MAG TPA: NAD-dependent epimerase/dehydratase family protein, partial [Holophagaceae bacterium]
EGLLLQWAQDMPRVSTLVARISNLYGPGQHLEKPQGLIAHISRSILHHLPIHIYVPLDTQRDYLYVEDCARELLHGLQRLGSAPRENVVKIFHSGESTTIAGVIGAFARIAKGHPRIICSASPVGVQQPLQLCFRSGVWPDLDRTRRTDLAVGIQRVHQHLLARFQEGRLPPVIPRA